MKKSPAVEDRLGMQGEMRLAAIIAVQDERKVEGNATQGAGCDPRQILIKTNDSQTHDYAPWGLELH